MVGQQELVGKVSLPNRVHAMQYIADGFVATLAYYSIIDNVSTLGDK